MRIHLLVASVILALAGAAQGQTYPNKPVKMLVGFAPGGSADLSARAVSDGLAAALGKPVVVENRPGAGSIVAATAVARSDPDGYTLMYGGISLSIQMAIDPAIPIDPLAEFQTIGLIAEAPNVLVVGNQIPARTVKELVGYARSHRISYGSVGVGTSLHLLGEILKDREKLDMVHVPYKGSVPALNDMMGGQLEMMFDNLITSMPLVKGGKVRALAVTTPKRTPQLPEVPTMVEAGYPDFETSVWFAVFAPRRTPRPVVDRIAAAIAASLADPKVTARFAPLGMDVLRSDSPDAADAFFRKDIRNWKATVQRTGVKVEKN